MSTTTSPGTGRVYGVARVRGYSSTTDLGFERPEDMGATPQTGAEPGRGWEVRE
jgi:hypothetical protein